MKIELADRLQGVSEYYFSKKLAEIEQLKSEGVDIINLGIGSPDMPPHSSVIEALHQSALLPSTHGYANYKGSAELLGAVAQWYGERYGVELDGATEVLTLYGSKEGLIFLCNTYINRGDRVLIPNPGYAAYSAAVKMVEGEVLSYELSADSGWLPCIESLPTSGVKMMMLNYPHMPTGARATKEFFERIVQWAKKHNILLVHDNPYSFIRNDSPLSILSVQGAKDVAVELNSLSKSHNMAGWRVGFMVGSPALISDVLRYKSNLNNSMFIPSQHAAAVALGLGEQWYESQNSIYREREKLGEQIFDILQCAYDKGQVGLFIWAKLPTGYGGDGYDFCDKILKEKGIFITPGGIFGSTSTHYIRVSLCASIETLKKTIDRLT